MKYDIPDHIKDHAILGIKKNVWKRVGSEIISIINGDTARIDGGLTIGVGSAGVDYFLKFNGESNDCTILWDEDENVLDFSESITINDKVGIGNAPLSNFNKFGFDDNVGGAGRGALIRYSAAGTPTGGGEAFKFQTSINLTSGHTLNDRMTSVLYSSVRDQSTDEGMIGKLESAQYNIGHAPSVNNNARIGSATAVIINMEYAAGSIDNFCGLHIRAGDSGGVVTNGYFICQEGSVFRNYFDANTGIGITDPLVKLHVSGGNIRGDSPYQYQNSTGVTGSFVESGGKVVIVSGGLIVSII